MSGDFEQFCFDIQLSHFYFILDFYLTSWLFSDTFSISLGAMSLFTCSTAFIVPAEKKKTLCAYEVFIVLCSGGIRTVSLLPSCSYLCPGSGSCPHREAPELRGLQSMHHWEPLPWKDLRDRELAVDCCLLMELTSSFRLRPDLTSWSFSRGHFYMKVIWNYPLTILSC